MTSISPTDDLLHPPPNADYTWSETNWFGMMFIPEHGFQLEPYVWLHPNLRVASAGLYVSKGIKRQQLAAEYWDFRSWLPFPGGDLDNYSLDNGMAVQILAPLKTYRIDYVDRAQATELHVIWDAIMPPVPFPLGAHLEQAGRVTGQLLMAGQAYAIDCIAIRDRSWVLRPENPKPGRRPIAMHNCGFEEDFVFCVTLPDSNAVRTGTGVEVAGWLAQADAPASEFVPFCWLWRDGAHRQVKHAVQRTYRRSDGMTPDRVEIEIIDDHDERYDITGEIVGAMPFQWMQNNLVMTCMTRFECNGKTGWGNVAESLEGDLVRAMLA